MRLAAQASPISLDLAAAELLEHCMLFSFDNMQPGSVVEGLLSTNVFCPVTSRILARATAPYTVFSIQAQDVSMLDDYPLLDHTMRIDGVRWWHLFSADNGGGSIANSNIFSSGAELVCITRVGSLGDGIDP